MVSQSKFFIPQPTLALGRHTHTHKPSQPPEALGRQQSFLSPALLPVKEALAGDGSTRHWPKVAKQQCVGMVSLGRQCAGMVSLGWQGHGVEVVEGWESSPVITLTPQS
jgi:hypothetical protein